MSKLFFSLYWLHLEENDEILTIGSFFFFIEIRISDEQYDKNDGYDEDDGLSCSENLEEQSEILDLCLSNENAVKKKTAIAEDREVGM